MVKKDAIGAARGQGINPSLVHWIAAMLSKWQIVARISCTANGLSVNSAKAEVVFFSNRRRVPRIVQLSYF